MKTKEEKVRTDQCRVERGRKALAQERVGRKI